jgi:predicted membrane-bound mannosyltransferase/DNA-binding beta-propeller fold protein YncE
MQLDNTARESWLEKPLLERIPLNSETLFWILLLVLALFSRFYILGARVMSHDENSHVYYSWRFYEGQGFAHDPLMHGPFQFHLIAPTYFMFGDNDFTARIPAAVFSVATVMFMWFYRRYLGKAGAMVAGLLMLISPYMLFYGRYVRNEAFVAFFGVVMIWAILRYLDTGKPMYLYTLTTVTVLHFTAKETAFIYTAQAMLFLAGYFIYRLSKVRWERPSYRNLFLLAMIAALILLGATGSYLLLNRPPITTDASITAAPALPGQELTPPAPSAPSAFLIAIILLSVVALLVALYFLIKGYGMERLRSDRSFSMLIILGTFVLPQLAAFPLRFAGHNVPTNVSDVMAMTTTDILWIGIFLTPMLLVSLAVGLLWNWRLWLVNAAIWYGLFTVFYTSVFTNGAGFFTGLVGSLGYWLEQQGVERGSQPLYYYALVQVPIYEYLPALGTWLAFGIAIWDMLKSSLGLGFASVETASPTQLSFSEEAGFPNGLEMPSNSAVEPAGETVKAPVFPLLGFWAVTSLLAYTVAGEKMPWLTVHITLPAILCSGWALGKLIDSIDWNQFKQRSGWLAIVLLPVFFLSAMAAIGSLLGTNPPFQGQELAQLQASSQFLVSLLAATASGLGLIVLLRPWPTDQFMRVLTLFFFAVLGILTTHATIQANFYNYDDANELLVYAHAAPGVKTALSQIEEISRRTTDGLAIQVAYDNETSYPYWWYLRNYPNAQYYGANPSRSLRDVPIILVGDANFGKIEPVVGNLYDRFDYIRLWWPNQDYFDLTWTRVKNALSNPAMREALFQIWLNRDYTEYGKVTNRDMSLPNWSPAARMRLYIRKDITSQLWNYGSVPAPIEQISDPFEGKQIELSAAATIGSLGAESGQFQHPRDAAVAPDGSVYVTDSENNRIQHLSPDGEVLQVWGSFADVTTGLAPGGTFNQPWGIAVAPDETVYVADTWNHRIQRFSSSGEFIQMWGYFGQAEQPEAFWGPRDVAVDAAGRVYVTDTGNKRVVIFNAEGEYVSQFGEAGMGAGQLDEPVGIGVDLAGLVYVADTWNQRIQVFRQDEQGQYVPFRSWELQAWYGQSLDNKPYLALDTQGHLFVSDPEGYRVLEFTVTGDPVRAWGDFGTGAAQFGMPVGVATSPDGSVWVVDTGNDRLMRFIMPE